MNAGIKVDTIIEGVAYSEKGNIELATQQGIKLVSKLTLAITQ